MKEQFEYKKMMKVILGMVCFIMLSMTSSAQTKFGIHGGMNTINLDSKQLILKDKNDVNEFGIALENANYGFHFGVFILAKSDFLFIKPQVQFNSQSVDYKLTNLKNSDTIGKVLKEKFQRIDVPLLLGVNLGPFRGGLGPVAHFNISSSSQVVDEIGPEYSIKVSDMSFGYVLGLGVDIWNFHLDVGYEGNFQNANNQIVYKDQTFRFDQTPSRFIGTIGISF